MPSTQLYEKVKKAIELSYPLTITTYKLPPETEQQIEEITGLILDHVGLPEYKDPLVYCLKELSVNAKKANTKRVYFEDQGLDIENRDDYLKGMANFKEDTLSNLDFYLERQKERGLYIKFTFQVVNEVLKIVIRNNVEINRKEQMRVYDRIARARAFGSLEEAFAEVLDDSEGAGLGIVILILMMKKLGLDEESFDIEGEDGETAATLTIPITGERHSTLETLMDQVVNSIEALPQFPENITAVQRLINDPDSEIEDIARRISADPTLTADLLKRANSAQFMLPNRVNNIPDAVMMLGFRGIKNMLYSYGTEKLLNISEDGQFWEHSHRVAFYAYSLSRSITRKKEVLDDAYIGGILHDIGHIIFTNLNQEMQDKIDNLAHDKHMDKQIFENLAAGYNHSEIGAKIAEKWSFPSSLVEAIRYHHSPLQCKSQNKAVVYCVYLANCLANIERQMMTFDLIDPKIMQIFKIKGEEELTGLLNRLSTNYDAELLN